ncbi:MAG TPA: hypothetical protein VKR82_14260 [Candidatus Acidoferrales bacterium]|nr:hypothetical protein [Candidatus Acidoferrales bacterium]
MLFQDTSKKLEDQDDDNAIYSEVIGQKYVHEGVERIVIGDHTSMGLPPILMGMTQFGNSEEAQKFRDAVAKETKVDYDQKNKSPVALEQKQFSLKVLVAMISEAERDRIFPVASDDKKSGSGHISNGKHGMEEFNRLYPKSQGFMSLSRIGFSPNKTQALVYVANVCGGLCGTGELYLLCKVDGKWKIQNELMVWIS